MDEDLDQGRSDVAWLQKSFTEQSGRDCSKSKAHRLYYDILGVKPNCGITEIRDAYLRLAREFHPDKSGDSNEAFQTISKVYNVLSGEQSRAIYDSLGEKGLELYAKTPSIAMKFSHFANVFGLDDPEVFEGRKGSAAPVDKKVELDDHATRSDSLLAQTGGRSKYSNVQNAQCAVPPIFLKPSLNDLAQAAERETELLESALYETSDGSVGTIGKIEFQASGEQCKKESNKKDAVNEVLAPSDASSELKRSKRRTKRKMRERSAQKAGQLSGRVKRAKEEMSVEDDEDSKSPARRRSTRPYFQDSFSGKESCCISPLMLGDFSFITGKKQVYPRRPVKQQSAPLLYSSIPKSVFTKLENANALELLEQIKQVKKMSECNMAAASSGAKSSSGYVVSVTSSVEASSQRRSLFQSARSFSTPVACAAKVSAVRESFVEQTNTSRVAVKSTHKEENSILVKNSPVSSLGKGSLTNFPSATSSAAAQTHASIRLASSNASYGDVSCQTCGCSNGTRQGQSVIHGNAVPRIAMSSASLPCSRENQLGKHTAEKQLETGTPSFKSRAPLVVEAFVESSILSGGGPVHVSYCRKRYCTECKTRRGNSSCGFCAGKGFISENTTLSIRLPPRSQSGQHMTIKGKGHVYNESEKGDLLMVLKEQK